MSLDFKSSFRPLKQSVFRNMGFEGKPKVIPMPSCQLARSLKLSTGHFLTLRPLFPRINFLKTLYLQHVTIEFIEETKHIRKLLNCIVLLESDDQGPYSVKRDHEGNAVGLIAQLTSSLKGNSTVTGDLTSKYE